jgi:hypothetical protein
MKTLPNFFARYGVLLLLILLSMFSDAAESVSAVASQWPRVTFRDGVTNIIYQPQLESWDYVSLQATSAVAIQPKGAEEPIFGTIHFKAKTRVDRVEREVFFEEIQITDGEFPSASAQATNYLATLRSLLPKDVRSISLDRLEASLAILEAQQKARSWPLNNDPPVILFSTTPAMLILVDGPPVYRPIEKTDLERVFNTRALILRDKTGTHYLHLFDGYMMSSTLSGPWTVATNVPRDAKRAESIAVNAKQVDLLAGQQDPETKRKPSLKKTPLPMLHVARVPTELILIHGEAQWSPILGTQLLYVTNTTSHIFKNIHDQKSYVLISGRWFRASGFSGPWEFVPSGNLPADFAKIPENSPKENVKAAVPGTIQAKEALIENGIPQTVKVDRAKARMDPPPQYDGPVQLQPIEGTSLSYVVNSPAPVINANGGSWYSCQNGVWFVAPAATGPWSAATSVPAEIYAIPPSSPMHYVVYARVYNYDDHYISAGTTPGYYGTVVDPEGVVVYGTGYHYAPYVGPTYYVSYYVSYGYGSNPCWTPWVGWAYGFGVGWAMADDWYWWCYCPPAPYWGPYWYSCYGAYYNAYGGITAWGPYGWAGTSGYIYHQNGPWTGVSRAAAGYNAWTGNAWASKYGRAYNSSTGTSVVGQRGAVGNVYSGNYAYGGRGVAYNEQSGLVGTGGKATIGNVQSGNSATIGRANVYNPNSGNVTHISGVKGEQGGVINVNGNVIAGRDGNYYRPDGQGGWDQVTRPGVPTAAASSADAQALRQANPQFATTPSGLGPYNQGQNPRAQTQWQPANPAPQQRQNLEREATARQAGAMRQSSYQRNRPAFSGGGRGRGGGGRRR